MANADDKGAGGALYQVIGQRPDFQQGDAGGFAQGYTVTIQTPAGHTGQVFVTADKYTEAQVRPILQKLAATLDAIGNLTS